MKHPIPVEGNFMLYKSFKYYGLLIISSINFTLIFLNYSLRTLKVRLPYLSQ